MREHEWSYDHVIGNTGSDYTADEIEFMMALDTYKMDNKRPFPRLSEILLVLKSLGYKKEILMTPARFSVGQKVKHPANAGGSFPAGTGTISTVTPWNTNDGYSYQVKCDKTGQVLPVNFKESELQLVAA